MIMKINLLIQLFDTCVGLIKVIKGAFFGLIVQPASELQFSAWSPGLISPCVSSPASFCYCQAVKLHTLCIQCQADCALVQLTTRYNTPEPQGLGHGLLWPGSLTKDYHCLIAYSLSRRHCLLSCNCHWSGFKNDEEICFSGSVLR